MSSIIKDYPTTSMLPYEFEHRGQLTQEIQKENPIVSRCYAFKEDAAHFFVKDNEHPYVQEKPFDWIRGYQVGGKSLLWARQVQRWSDFDFEGPARDGFAVDWPIRYKDIAPWYSHVEKFAGVSGNKDGLASLPDGEFLPGFPLNVVEEYFQGKLKEHYGDERHMILARCAHITGNFDYLRTTRTCKMPKQKSLSERLSISAVISLQILLLSLGQRRPEI
jgi:choline dehydrogenase-like flavoprotein